MTPAASTLVCFLYPSGGRGDLRSFPTRRSSDLAIDARLTIAPRFCAIIVGSTAWLADRESTRLNSSHRCISYAGFSLKKNKNKSDWGCSGQHVKLRLWAEDSEVSELDGAAARRV